MVFAAFLYRNFNLPVSLLAGAGAGLFCGLNDCFLPWGWNIAYGPADKLAYIISPPSPAPSSPAYCPGWPPAAWPGREC